MANAQVPRIVDRSRTRRLSAEALSGTAFEAVLTLRVLNGGASLDQFEHGPELEVLGRDGLPATVTRALERLRTPSGDHWSALLAFALRAGPRHDVASLLAIIKSLDPIDVKLAMLGSDRSGPSCNRDVDAADFRAAAAGRRDAVDRLLARAEAAGWDAEVRPLLEVPSRSLAILVLDALRDLPQADDASELLERNVAKTQAWLAGLDEVEAVIERVTNGVQYRPEPGISRIALVPSLVHRPWTLIESFGDTKIFCYPARPDSELSAPDDLLIGIYRALGDGTRLRLLRRLVGGIATVGQLSAELHLAKSTVHEHILSLRTAGLVRSVAGGYEIEPELPDLNWLLKEFLGLEMRRECEGCGAGLDLDAIAYICSYECTFCAKCAQDRNQICPNCGGELVLRPRRNPTRAMRRKSVQSHSRPRTRVTADPSTRVQP